MTEPALVAGFVFSPPLYVSLLLRVPPMKTRYVVPALVISLLLSGCSLFVVADAAVTVVATTVKVGAKVVGAAADAVIPDGDDKHDKQEKKSD